MSSKVKQPATKVVECKCQHDFQDRIYGPKKRLCNLLEKKGKAGEKQAYACTVCRSIHL